MWNRWPSSTVFYLYMLLNDQCLQRSADLANGGGGGGGNYFTFPKLQPPNSAAPPPPPPNYVIPLFQTRSPASPYAPRSLTMSRSFTTEDDSDDDSTVGSRPVDGKYRESSGTTHSSLVSSTVSDAQLALRVACLADLRKPWRLDTNLCCPDCPSTTFASALRLIRHCATDHPTRAPPVQRFRCCERVTNAADSAPCDFQTATETALIHHLARAHPTRSTVTFDCRELSSYLPTRTQREQLIQELARSYGFHSIGSNPGRTSLEFATHHVVAPNTTTRITFLELLDGIPPEPVPDTVSVTVSAPFTTVELTEAIFKAQQRCQLNPTTGLHRSPLLGASTATPPSLSPPRAGALHPTIGSLATHLELRADDTVAGCSEPGPPAAGVTRGVICTPTPNCTIPPADNPMTSGGPDALTSDRKRVSDDALHKRKTTIHPSMETMTVAERIQWDLSHPDAMARLYPATTAHPPPRLVKRVCGATRVSGQKHDRVCDATSRLETITPPPHSPHSPSRTAAASPTRTPQAVPASAPVVIEPPLKRLKRLDTPTHPAAASISGWSTPGLNDVIELSQLSRMAPINGSGVDPALTHALSPSKSIEMMCVAQATLERARDERHARTIALSEKLSAASRHAAQCRQQVMEAEAAVLATQRELVNELGDQRYTKGLLASVDLMIIPST